MHGESQFVGWRRISRVTAMQPIDRSTARGVLRESTRNREGTGACVRSGRGSANVIACDVSRVRTCLRAQWEILPLPLPATAEATDSGKTHVSRYRSASCKIAFFGGLVIN
jgi:hypothetical protein